MFVKLKPLKKHLTNVSVLVTIGVVMFFTGRLTRAYLPGYNEDVHQLAAGGGRSDALTGTEDVGDTADTNTDIVEVIQELEPVPWVYNSQFKNPCWWSSASLKCLPYFYIVGMPGAGTQYLFHAIMDHPEAVYPGFTEADFFWKKDIADLERGEVFSYVDTYNTASEQMVDYLESLSDRHEFIPLITGDASPYLTRWWNTSHITNQEFDPGFTILDYVFHLVPTAKIIIIFRNPVERLYEEYCTSTKWGEDPDWPSPSHFHDKVSKAITIYNMMFRFRPIRKCVKSKEGLNLAEFGLLFGLHYYYWEELIRIFPRNQILVLQHSSLFTDDTKQLVYGFLGMRLLTPGELYKLRWMRYRGGGGFNACGGKKMLWRTRVMLQDFYEPYNQMMAELMDNEEFLYRT